MSNWRLLAIFLLASNVSIWGKPLRVVVISDLNGSYGQVTYAPRIRKAITRIQELHPDLVICTGDMIAAQRRRPKLSSAQLQKMWSEFHRVVTEPLARSGIPMVATPGNHDASAYAGYERERTAYSKAWESWRPNLEFLNSANYPFRYVFRIAHTVFVSLDANRKGPLMGEQLEWLRHVLESPNVASSSKVVFGHLPVWPVSQGRETEFLDDAELRNLLSRFSVRLYLSGHHHAFYAGQDGPTLHVSQASLGSGPRRLIGSSEISPRAFTLIEIGEDGTVKVDAYREPNFRQTIDLATLPLTIRIAYGSLPRFDSSPEK